MDWNLSLRSDMVLICCKMFASSRRWSSFKYLITRSWILRISSRWQRNEEESRPQLVFGSSSEFKKQKRRRIKRWGRENERRPGTTVVLVGLEGREERWWGQAGDANDIPEVYCTFFAAILTEVPHRLTQTHSISS